MNITQIKSGQIFYQIINHKKHFFAKLNKPIESSLSCDNCDCKKENTWNSTNFTNNVHFCINNVDYDLQPIDFYIKDNNQDKIRIEPLYKLLAITSNSYQNCNKQDNRTKKIIDWQDKHENNFSELIYNCFFTGSGIDCSWEFDIESMNNNKMIFSNSWHVMHENGMYQGYIDFTVTITSNLQSDFDLLIKGNFGKHQDIKEYLYDSLNVMFSQKINKDTLKPIEGE